MAAPLDLTLQLAVCAAEYQLSKTIVPQDPDIGINSEFFFRVPDSKKTTYINDAGQREMVRQCGFFLRDVIDKKQETLFIRRLTYKFIIAYMPDDWQPTIRRCTRCMVAIIWELEWAFWMGRGKITPHAPWNVFFQYNTEEWNYNMTPVLGRHASQQTAAKLAVPGPRVAKHKDEKEEPIYVPDDDEESRVQVQVIPDDEAAVAVFGEAPTIGSGKRFNPYWLP